MDIVWTWGIFGFVLLAIELATGTLYVIWFGIAALLVAMVLWLMPSITVPIQLFLFAVLSLGTLALWKKYEKKLPAASRLGQSQGEEIGRTGIIVKPVGPQQNGRIQFAQGLMGSREWTAVSAEQLEAGELAVVAGVEGNALRVVKQRS